MQVGNNKASRLENMGEALKLSKMGDDIEKTRIFIPTLDQKELLMGQECVCTKERDYLQYF